MPSFIDIDYINIVWYESVVKVSKNLFFTMGGHSITLVEV